MANQKYLEIKNFWNQAGKSRLDKDGLRPTVRDPFLQALIEEAVCPYLIKKNIVLDIGCGDAISTIKFSSHVRRIIGIDYSKALLKIAKKNIKKSNCNNIKLVNMDISDISKSKLGEVNSIISIRCLINLPTEKLQFKVLNNLWRILPKDGYLLISECYSQGIKGINKRREGVGLEKIKVVKYNNYLDKEKFERFIKDKFKIICFKGFGLYLYLTRVVHPALVFPKQPKHNSLINKLFMRLQLLEGSNKFQDCDYVNLYILKKK